MKMITMQIIMSLLLACCHTVSADDAVVPQESMVALEEIMSAVHEEMYIANDEFWHRGDFTRCIEMTSFISQIAPWDIEAYSLTAWLMSSELRDEEAEKELLLGLQKNPDNGMMWMEVSRFYYLHMDFEAALACADIAMVYKQPPHQWRYYALLLERNGRFDEALAVWQALEAAQIDPAINDLQLPRLRMGKSPPSVPEMTTKGRENRKERARKIRKYLDEKDD